MTVPIRIGVIGVGGFGSRHLDAYVRHPQVEIVGVADVNSEAAQQAAHRFQVEQWFQSAEEMINGCAPDGVSVVTSSNEHVEPTLHALQAGCSVLLEKPVATSSADVVRLLQAERSASGFVMPGHVLRFASPYIEAKEYLEAGRLGKLLGIATVRDRGRDHQERYANDDPALLTLIHDVDLALWLSSARPLRVTAHRGPRSPSGNAPLVWATVYADDDSVWSLRTSWLLPNDVRARDRLELYGDEGAFFVEINPHASAYEDALDAEIEHFCSCIRFSRVPTQVTLEDAAIGIRVVEAVIDSATAAGEPVHVRP